uniref:C2H2-type domain-containing protein n=1 Tax=Anopheles dirus TaxID=7168 RepID=A0A182NQN8_9DIPT
MDESSVAMERKGVEDKMDDNENYIECSKMNFSQFTNPFAGPNQFAAAKFPQNLTTAASNGQVLGLVSGSEGAMQFLRPMDGTAVSAASAMFQQPQSQHGQVVTAAGMPHPGMASPAYITLPITMPGAKPGDAQQTVQIQVLNPNPLPSQTAGSAGAAGQPGSGSTAPKFQMGPMQIPIQSFQQGTTVLTVAYSPQDEEVLHNQGLPEGMTIVAALQPQDLQLLASQNPGTTTILQHHQQQQQQQQQPSANSASSPSGGVKIDSENPPPLRQIKQESPTVWNQQTLVPGAMHTTSNLLEIVQQQQQQQHHLHQMQQQQQQSRPSQNLNLQPYLKFNSNANGTTIMNGGHVLQQVVLPSGVTIGPGIIKQELPDDHSNENTQFGPADSSSQAENGGGVGSPDGGGGVNGGRERELEPGEIPEDGNNNGGNGAGTTPSGKARKKRKYKTKPPKPKRQKPGQVHIATAIDGTVLFCCPECHMAYPEKECLEQHLVVHKIERRFICDICGAGLKRKEHLERHKLGHNPERPFICNVCEKGFKRKEHLNLHYICNDCGKGFYRKDHLRKHIKSHLTKRLKEEKASNRNNNNNNASGNRNTSNGAPTTIIANGSTPSTSIAALPPGLTITTSSGNMHSGGGGDGGPDGGQSNAAQQQQNLLQSAISLPQGVTIHVPTADNQTLPVQISLPHLVAQHQTDTDGSTRTVLVANNSPENLNHLHLSVQQASSHHSTITTTTPTTTNASSAAVSTAL